MMQSFTNVYLSTFIRTPSVQTVLLAAMKLSTADRVSPRISAGVGNLCRKPESDPTQFAEPRSSLPLFSLRTNTHFYHFRSG